MPSAFLSRDARLRETWKKAFPDLIAGTLAQVPPAASMIWVLRPTGARFDTLNLVSNIVRQAAERPVILLADEPGEEEAMLALSAGASGYCNGHAAPAVLAQVALAVGNGGVWVGQGLLQRLLAATSRRLAASSAASEANQAAWRERLTAREREVAILLARGESNKEIARRMDITERTVKAHVGAMLEKLGVRDRLQLSLIINGLEAPRG
ncbi:MAG: response regulator transcription factor [Candidatus Accumulibacter sp.]|jgi:DNA-binding NarL/FixJ family response regulator|nr:response regulator transcription factor [Accumulibacter sp.]